MRCWAFWIGIIAVVTANGQALKERALGEAVARDIERRDGKIEDPAILEYLQRVENRIAAAAGATPLEVRLTRSTLQSASLLPNGVLYVSGGLLERMQNEAELAGLFAHEMAHGPWFTSRVQQLSIPLLFPSCVLASPVALASSRERREPEFQATESAVKTLQAAGYEPEAVIDLFSKLSYEHPMWSKAILSDDLIGIRAGLDSDVAPAAGYTVDSSAFREQHSLFLKILRPEADRKPPSSLQPR
jgi:Zn-dependent protease with chaperone function